MTVMKEKEYKGYAPPFTVSSRAVSLVAEISAQIERYAIRLEQTDGLRLRKANRIKTIHSSLAIEGNRLSESQVHDILEGKQVVAPPREIQEVRNAIRTLAVEFLFRIHQIDIIVRRGQLPDNLVDLLRSPETQGIQIPRPTKRGIGRHTIPFPELTLSQLIIIISAPGDSPIFGGNALKGFQITQIHADC